MLTRVALLICTGVFALAGAGVGEPFVLNDDGGWCWFQDERVLVHGGKLWVVSVASGRTDPSRKGNVEVVTRDLAAGTTARFVLHPQLHANDHATPALLALPDGRVVTLYSGHNHPRMFHRTTERPHDVTAWTPATEFIPGEALAGGRHQLFRGRSGDRGRTFRWEQLTRTPDADNLRPVVPLGSPPGKVAVVWMRGQYRTYTDYDLEMVGLVLPASR